MKSSTLKIPTARIFKPLLVPSRYKGAHGGRGSGKSHFFAGQLVSDSMREPGMRSVCIREVQKSLKESAKRLIEDKLEEFKLGEADGWKVYNDVIQTPGDGIVSFQGMQDHTAESIKSLEGYGRAWVEEAQTLSKRSLELLRPTIRAENSELWFSWNPRRKVDPVDALLRAANPPTGALVIRANWSDNPWFPSVLEQERKDCLQQNPDQYGHIWDGEYATAIEGAYFAKELALAKRENRICRVPIDPLMQIRAIWDIGGTGAKADACAIWICQFIGKEIRVLNHYEAVGQPLATHIAWLRAEGYGKALCILPHDGSTNDRIHDVSFESALRAAMFEVRVVPNQGKGAAKMRIEAARRRFPSIWFNEETTKGGIDALGWYHEKKDDARDIGLGPDHDWSSHSCFDGTTEVLTRYGTCQIMNLPKNGEILTPCGWKQYVHPRITKRNASLVEVRFKDGYSVKCTPDHLFLTGSGWKSAESLAPNTAIQSTLTKSRSISMAACIAYGQVKVTFLGAVKNFTEMSGKAHLVPYRNAVISTTGTETYSIIGSKILNVWTRASIARCLGRQGRNRKTVNILQQMPAIKRRNGIAHQKDDCGTNGTPNALKDGQNGSVKKSHASIVGSFIWPWLEKVVILANIVLSLARQRHTESAAKAKNTHVAIESVKPLKERSDVWDITVPDGRCFSLANGSVVHNSDSFGLMCVVYREPYEMDEDDDWDREHDDQTRSSVTGY